MASHPGLQEEQAHIDRAYERVESMRAAAGALLESTLRQRGGTPQALAERDVMVRTTLQRLDQLEMGRESLCFGRIDREDGESFHIGRLAVSSEDHEPLVVDWRAPVAEPFYRATGRHPMGLVRRRHFATEGRRVVGIEDEVFGLLGADGDVSDHDLSTAEGAGAIASGALLAALTRARSGRMRDIVATVQKEQDEVIRAELPGVLVVQGGPGTGKTAVALHRAAYLLYTHRFPLERQGVLVVGPNPLFLRYIEQVLPSLGESGVVLTTIEGLVPEARVRGVDSPLAAQVKSDPRMAQVVARAVRDRQRPLREDLEVGFEGFALRLTAEATRQVVSSARRRPGAHNSRRRHVEALVARRLHAQYQQAALRRLRAGLRGAEEDESGTGVAEGSLTEADLWRAVRRQPEVTAALDRMWPVLLPAELLHDLYGAAPLVRLAARGILTDEEQAALRRGRSATLDTIPWTASDLPLLDEAAVLLGPARARSGEDEAIRSYGHIVADEAQDLTPMQLRMLARRSLSGSMTVVGDVAQATGQRAPSGWGEITAHLPDRRPARMAELSVNYRTPAEIMDVAARVLAEAAPHLRPPRSVRSGEPPPAMVATGPETLVAEVVERARRELAAVDGGTVALIAAPSMTDALAAGLDRGRLPFGDAHRSGLDAHLTLLSVALVKGLEFDAVVVVEPARVVAEAAQGLRALYVALTRATRRLTVVHAEPLPPVLGDASPPADLRVGGPVLEA
ncbi:MAG: AAA family ATPase [Actinomycetota bacterium]|nr:AAA family ATPase [Actinomycetota bacterium]